MIDFKAVYTDLRSLANCSSKIWRRRTFWGIWAKQWPVQLQFCPVKCDFFSFIAAAINRVGDELGLSWDPQPATNFMASPKLLFFYCLPSRFYIPVIHQLQNLYTFCFSFVFWRLMGSSSCPPLMDVYMDFVVRYLMCS